MKGPPASDPPAQPAAQKQTASSTSKPLQAGEFRVTCGHCAKSIRVPLKMVGQAGACPKCNYVFVIPPPGQQPLVAKTNERVIIEEPIVLDEAVAADDAVVIDEPIVLDEQPILMDDPFFVTSVPAIPANIPVYSPPSYQQPAPQYSPLGPTYGTATKVHHPLRKSSAMPRSIATTKVCGIVLVILACANTLFHGFNSLSFLLLPSEEFKRQMAAKAAQRGSTIDVEAMLPIIYLLGIASMLVLFGIFLTMAYGGVQMIRLKQWGAGLAASICALLPCSCYTFFISVPLGIVSIVMLCQANVKSEFD